MGKRARTVLIVVAGLIILSTPLVWLLGDPNAGQLVGASIQAGAGVLALLYALLQGHNDQKSTDIAAETGDAETSRGGWANSGLRRPKGQGSATVRKTGKATAKGDGSQSNTGIDYS